MQSKSNKFFPLPQPFFQVVPEFLSYLFYKAFVKCFTKLLKIKTELSITPSVIRQPGYPENSLINCLGPAALRPQITLGLPFRYFFHLHPKYNIHIDAVK